MLDDSGSGAYSTIIKGLKYVLKKKKANRGRAMVVNMSLGGGFSAALNDVVNKLASKGIPVVVSAGNDAADACNQSPASALLMPSLWLRPRRREISLRSPAMEPAWILSLPGLVF